MWKWIYKLASPPWFYGISHKLVPWFAVTSMILFAVGLTAGLFLAPADYQQGDSFRIIYIHVPAAMLSMMVYATMAISSIIFFVWRIKLAAIIAKASAPIGASFALLALITGSIWGKPMWGTWWVWDARLTSELILLFLYCGYIALQSAITNIDKADKASALLAIVGVIDLPIIHYSVEWWQTLHQGATISKLAMPSIAPSMLYPLLLTLAAFVTFYVTVMLLRAQNEILWREQLSAWVKKELQTI